jgi:hypothetical protein
VKCTGNEEAKRISAVRKRGAVKTAADFYEPWQIMIAFCTLETNPSFLSKDDYEGCKHSRSKSGRDEWIRWEKKAFISVVHIICNRILEVGATQQCNVAMLRTCIPL